MERTSINLFIRTYAIFFLMAILSACVNSNENLKTSTIQSGNTNGYQRDDKPSLRDNLLKGKYYKARNDLENDTLDSRNVFTFMNRGMLRRMTGDYVGSNQSFESAKKLIDSLYGVSISEKLGAAAFTDVVTSYAGNSYERILLHMYMAMNYLQLNNYSSARVEVLQADVLMGEHAENDPFVRYLSGLIFYALGEYDQAIVEYRKAITAYKKELLLGMIPYVPPDLIEDFITLLSDEGLIDEANIYRKEYSLSYSLEHEIKYRKYKKYKNYGEVVIIVNFGVTPAEIDTTHFNIAKNMFLKDTSENYTNNIDALKVDSFDFSVNIGVVKNIAALAEYNNKDLTGTNFRIFSNTIEGWGKQFKTDSPFTMESYFDYVKDIETKVSDKRSWVSLPNKILMLKLLMPIGEYDIGITMPNEHGRSEFIAKINVSVKHGELVFSSLHAMPPISDATLRNEARLGNPDAQYSLAKRLEERNKLTELDDNNETALFWYEKSADSGHAPSQIKMFRLFVNGTKNISDTHSENEKVNFSKKTVKVIIEKDRKKALHYLKLASDNHHPYAMDILARGYEGYNGLVPNDRNKSLELHKEIVIAIETDRYSWRNKYPWGGKIRMETNRKPLLERSKHSIRSIERSALRVHQKK